MWFKIRGNISHVHPIAIGHSIREIKRPRKDTVTKHYVVCVRNEGYEVSLERRKIYRVIPDKKAIDRNLIRIVDESGQSYLYPHNYFVAITLPQPILKALALAG